MIEPLVLQTIPKNPFLQTRVIQEQMVLGRTSAHQEEHFGPLFLRGYVYIMNKQFIRVPVTSFNNQNDMLAAIRLAVFS